MTSIDTAAMTVWFNPSRTDDQASGSLTHLFQTKEEVGQRVLQGILNDLPVIKHERPEYFL